jgi:Zn-finger nucleic acid-binding protein
MESLYCPKCQSRLETVTYRGIEVDRCLNCAGIWFDNLEAEQLKAIAGSESLDIAESVQDNGIENLSSVVFCPRCHFKMMRKLDIDQHNVWYEKCPQCHGIWLDAGEFRKFKQNFQPKGLLNRLKTLFLS